MIELFLEYTNDHGDRIRVPVSSERSFVGRHSESDVYIPDGRLSRTHMQIERVGDSFVASDAGSSNGTFLNGSPLTHPAAIKNGDVLDLGGFTVRVAIESSEVLPEAEPSPDIEEPQESVAPEPQESVAPEPPLPVAGDQVSVVTQPPPGSNSMMLWIIVPVFGLMFIFFAGVIVFLVASGSSNSTATKPADTRYDDDDLYEDNDDEKLSNKSENNRSSNNSTTTSGSNTSGSPSNSSGSNSLPPVKLTETAKIEQNGALFLRRIAHNDPRAFLTTEQAGRLNTKIKQFSGSSAVADNLKSAAKNASQIKSLADSKNLKPQFVAIAAAAKLGSSRGDVLQTAQSMIDVLGKLTVHLGSELADDSLLVIAAYSQGAAGETMKMRNMLQQLANQSPESSRVIRTIWFLHKNGKITNAEFENALTFLAIGTISQNPKEFGINAEPLAL